MRAATTMPLRPMLDPAQAAACQVWAPTPGTKVAAVICAVGTTQLTSPESLEAEADGFRLLGENFIGSGRLDGPAQGLLQLFGEFFLFGSELITAGFFNRAAQNVAQGVVEKDVGVVGALLELHAGSGGEGAGFGAIHDALPDAVQDLRVRIARDEIHFGKGGHDVRGACPPFEMM